MGKKPSWSIGSSAKISLPQSTKSKVTAWTVTDDADEIEDEDALLEAEDFEKPNNPQSLCASSDVIF